MDKVDPATRSRMMAAVPQRDTKPEIRLRKALHRLGVRYRLHDPSLPGRPDLVFPRYRAAVFVHGCFWHAHGCRYSTVPAARRDFWLAKFDANRARDARVTEELSKRGWRVLVVWECELRPPSSDAPERAAQRVKAWLQAGEVPTARDQPELHAASE